MSTRSSEPKGARRSLPVAGLSAQHPDGVKGCRELLRDQVIGGRGLVAHPDDEPVGWCSLAQRSETLVLPEEASQSRPTTGLWPRNRLMTTEFVHAV